jgi:hypothetical protein
MPQNPHLPSLPHAVSPLFPRWLHPLASESCHPPQQGRELMSKVAGLVGGHQGQHTTPAAWGQRLPNPQGEGGGEEGGWCRGRKEDTSWQTLVCATPLSLFKFMLNTNITYT